MKFTTLVTPLLLSGLAVADDVQSKPFKLVLSSTNKDIDGKILDACHSGAAIEGLCLSNSTTSDQYSQYYFNTTAGVASPVQGYEPSGKLVWNLPIRKSSTTPYPKTERKKNQGHFIGSRLC